MAPANEQSLRFCALKKSFFYIVTYFFYFVKRAANFFRDANFQRTSLAYAHTPFARHLQPGVSGFLARRGGAKEWGRVFHFQPIWVAYGRAQVIRHQKTKGYKTVTNGYKMVTHC